MKNALLFTILIIGSMVFSQDKNVYLILNNNIINNNEINFFVKDKKVDYNKIINFNGVDSVIITKENKNIIYKLFVENNFSINDYSELLKLLGFNYVCIDDKCTDIKYFKISDASNPPVVMEYEKAGISGTLDHYNSLIEQLKYKIYSYQKDEISLVNGLISGYFAHKDKQLQRLLNEKQALLNK